MKCTYQGKTHCFRKEPLKISYGIKEWILGNLLYNFSLWKRQGKRDKLNISPRITTYLVLEIALGQYLHKGSYTW
jgi:hypothetical protein